MLKRGEADIAYSIRGALAEELRRTPRLALKPTSGAFTEWVLFIDQWDPKSPWSDRRVRLAANYAIDRQGMNQAEYLGLSKVTYLQDEHRPCLQRSAISPCATAGRAPAPRSGRATLP